MRRERGFTLTELMIVVAIIGVLTTLVVVSVRGDPRPMDAAAKVAQLVEEASRTAVSRGFDPTLAAADGTRRRTRIIASGNPVELTAEVLDDVGGAPTWTRLDSYTFPKNLISGGYAMQVGTYSTVTPSTSWAGFELSCFPDGTCTAATLFFRSDRGTAVEQYARVSVLPLGAATFVRNTWE